MKPPLKPPVVEKPPSPAQIAKANARRIADGLPPLDENGKIPRSFFAGSFDREKLAEKVEAIMAAPRTNRKPKTVKRKPMKGGQ